MTEGSNRPGKRRLYLHVGPHKTGTTSFQMALAERNGQDGLQVYVEQEGRKNPINAGRLANVFTRRRLVTMPRLKGFTPIATAELRAEKIAHLAGQASAGTGDFVISSEAFSHLRTAKEATLLRRALSSYFDPVLPILTRRDVNEWAVSRKDQLQKTDVWEQISALPDARSCNGAWYFDWDALVAFWEDFGPVRIVDYETALTQEGSVLPALARALDRPGLFDGADLWLNRRETGDDT